MIKKAYIKNNGKTMLYSVQRASKVDLPFIPSTAKKVAVSDNKENHNYVADCGMKGVCLCTERGLIPMVNWISGIEAMAYGE